MVRKVPISGSAVGLEQAADFKRSYERMRAKAGLPRPRRRSRARACPQPELVSVPPIWNDCVGRASVAMGAEFSPHDAPALLGASMHWLTRRARFEPACIRFVTAFALGAFGMALPVGDAVAQRLTDGQIPRATIDQLIASARDAQIDASCIHFGKILGELRHRGLSSVGGVTSVKPVYDMLEAEGCPRRAISNQPSIEVGVATGGTFISNGNGFARGTDSFGGILRVDQEPMNFGKRASRWAVL